MKSAFFRPHYGLTGLVLACVVVAGPAAVANVYSVSNLNDSGAGSLRQAVADANANPGSDVVVFAVGLGGVITLTTGPISISSDMTIDGPGADVIAISGNSASRVFTAGNVVASINNVTMKDGRSPGGTGSQGGLIHSQGQLSLARCTLSGGVASAVTAAYGGGIYHTGGSLALDSCTFSGCSAGAGTFAGGGGVAVLSAALTMTNCTLSGNSCTAGTVAFGGGVYTSHAQADLVNCTVATNSVSAVFPEGGGLTAENQSIVRLKNCLFANPTPGNLSVRSSSLQSLGNNLVTDASSGFLNGVNGDIVNVGLAGALLGPLGDYGGPVSVQALLPGSPAIDAGGAGPDVPPVDQRGLPRADGDCETRAQPDIGAFEYSGGAGVNLNGEDQCARAQSYSDFQLGHGFTIEAVVRADKLFDASGATRIVSTRGNGVGGYGFGQSNGKLVFTTFGVKDYITANAYLLPGLEYHVAVVFDSSDDASFYVNGQFVQKVLGVAPAGTNAAQLYVGRNPPESLVEGQHWDGQISEVRFWNVARTSSQIAANYDTPLSGSETGLLAYWRFLEGQGESSADLAGAGTHDLRILKQPYWMQPTRCACFPCDANCDGSVNQFDIQPFVAAVATHAGCGDCAGDVNGDGTTNTFDIGGFVSCLTP